jgi:hypothetical protein
MIWIVVLGVQNTSMHWMDQLFWPIQVETNLTQDEIKYLEEARFVLNRWQLIFLWSLFKGESFIPINRLVDEMLWPTSCNGKVIRCIMPSMMSNLHYNRWEAKQLFEVIINPPSEVPLLDIDKSIKFYLAKIKKKINMKLQ